MKNEKIATEYGVHTAVWLALVALIGASSTFIETRAAGWVAVFIAAAGVKFLAIGLQFMEVRRAHAFWIIWLMILFGVYAVGALFFLRP
jgi:hypothetical protein